jgi:hypothetical protein
MITPELAAQIVKEYIIPMFDKPSAKKGSLISEEIQLTDALYNKLEQIKT